MRGSHATQVPPELLGALCAFTGPGAARDLADVCRDLYQAVCTADRMGYWPIEVPRDWQPGPWAAKTLRAALSQHMHPLNEPPTKRPTAILHFAREYTSTVARPVVGDRRILSILRPLRTLYVLPLRCLDIDQNLLYDNDILYALDRLDPEELTIYGPLRDCPVVSAAELPVPVPYRDRVQPLYRIMAWILNGQVGGSGLRRLSLVGVVLFVGIAASASHRARLGATLVTEYAAVESDPAIVQRMRNVKRRLGNLERLEVHRCMAAITAVPLIMALSPKLRELDLEEWDVYHPDDWTAWRLEFYNASRTTQGRASIEETAASVDLPCLWGSDEHPLPPNLKSLRHSLCAFTPTEAILGRLGRPWSPRTVEVEMTRRCYLPVSNIPNQMVPVADAPPFVGTWDSPKSSALVHLADLHLTRFHLSALRPLGDSPVLLPLLRRLTLDMRYISSFGTDVDLAQVAPALEHLLVFYQRERSFAALYVRPCLACTATESAMALTGIVGVPPNARVEVRIIMPVEINYSMLFRREVRSVLIGQPAAFDTVVSIGPALQSSDRPCLDMSSWDDARKMATGFLGPHLTQNELDLLAFNILGPVVASSSFTATLLALRHMQTLWSTGEPLSPHTNDIAAAWAGIYKSYRQLEEAKSPQDWFRDVLPYEETPSSDDPSAAVTAIVHFNNIVGHRFLSEVLVHRMFHYAVHVVLDGNLRMSDALNANDQPRRSDFMQACIATWPSLIAQLPAISRQINSLQEGTGLMALSLLVVDASRHHWSVSARLTGAQWDMPVKCDSPIKSHMIHIDAVWYPYEGGRLNINSVNRRS